MKEQPKKITNSKPIPHIPLPFKEVMADVLKVKPPNKKPKVETLGRKERTR
jgi:hypothetical protein